MTDIDRLIDELVRRLRGQQSKHQRRNRSNHCHRYRDKAFCLVGQMMLWQALSDRPAGDCPCLDYRKGDNAK